MRFRLFPLLLAALFVSSACGILPADLQHELLPAQSQYKTAEAAFAVMVERHVDKPSSKILVPGALDGVTKYLTDSKIAPNPVVDRPDLTGSTWSDFAKLSSALDKVVAQFPNADKTLVERAAVDGMARAMNECHTYYLDPNRARGYLQRPEPVSGIGALVTQPVPNGLVEVVGVIPNTPAERAGVRSGDKILKVNGEDVSQLTTDEVVQKIRGPEGTTVTITFLRDTSEVVLTITRARFQEPLFISRLESNSIGYIRIPQLIASVADDVGQAARNLESQGAKAWILDLRDDPGGELGVAVDVASLFVPSGTLVYQTGRDGQKTPIEVNKRRFLGSTKPLVVLVNKNSASGSEIIAAGVRSNDAGTVMGTQTAGCVGSAQPRELPDGGLLLVTLTKMQDSKTGADLNGPGKGVVPDQIVQPAASGGPDTQLQAAVDYIRTHAAADRPALAA